MAILLALAATLLAGLAGPARAQSLDDVCRIQLDASECRLAVESVRVLIPRMSTALWGGNGVAGTASTLGMRIGTMPRLSFGGRVTLAPTRLPPLVDRTASTGENVLFIGMSADLAVGLLPGFSPLPTVGGVLSLDLLARASYLGLPVSEGFHDDAIWGGSLGARLGLLRESFTLPGLSLTGSYRWTRETAYGDPATGSTDGYFDSGVRNYHLAAAASKRVALIRLTGGAAVDRYVSDVEAAYSMSPGGTRIPIEGEVVTDRWSLWANASFTTLIFTAALELGLHEAPIPDGLPSDVDLDPSSLYGGLAFRISI